MKERLKWFREARFGMFIHWGVYSMLGRGEWVMFHENIPAREYEKYAWQFNPPKYHPEKWVALAKEAGMKYMVLTTRHCDGFSLFDSKVSNFTSVKTAAKRDLVAEFVKACRKANMKIGFYYSLIDWRWPVAYQGPQKNPSDWKKLVEYVHTQVKELCTNYGKIDILWYDGSFYVDKDKGGTIHTTAEDWYAKKLNAMVRKYQPHILINDRSGLPEDFDTPEGHIIPSKSGRFWEVCMPMNIHWGYSIGDNIWKSPNLLIHDLSRSVSLGGNYLVNVGPKPDGTIPYASITRLRQVGEWLSVNGEAIYGAEQYLTGTENPTTFKSKENAVYLIILWWPGERLTLPQVKGKIEKAYILSTKQKIKLERKRDRLILHGLPSKPPDSLGTVIVMKID